MLPVVPLETGTVSVAGTDVPIRSLSRIAVLALGNFDDLTATEVYIVAKGTGSTDDEARAWLDSVSAETGDVLLKAIAVISGIRKGDSKEPLVDEAEPGEA